jgi:spore coat-associated protein N
MNLKKNIIVGILTGLVGLALISGGTVAYFYTSLETNNEILSGELKLDISEVENDILFKFKNKKPGDTFEKKFDLINAGTLNMKDITLTSEYKAFDKEDNQNNDFAKQIRINKIEVNGNNVLNKKMTIAQLSEENRFVPLMDELEIDSDIPVLVEFEFIRTDKDQNKYQGNKMELVWTFEAKQTDGEIEKAN